MGFRRFIPQRDESLWTVILFQTDTFFERMCITINLIFAKGLMPDSESCWSLSRLNTASDGSYGII